MLLLFLKAFKVILRQILKIHLKRPLSLDVLGRHVGISRLGGFSVFWYLYCLLKESIIINGSTSGILARNVVTSFVIVLFLASPRSSLLLLGLQLMSLLHLRKFLAPVKSAFELVLLELFG